MDSRETTNATQLEIDAEKLRESAVLSKLQLSPEERIESHENARKLAVDLQNAIHLENARS